MEVFNPRNVALLGISRGAVLTPLSGDSHSKLSAFAVIGFKVSETDAISKTATVFTFLTSKV